MLGLGRMVEAFHAATVPTRDIVRVVPAWVIGSEAMRNGTERIRTDKLMSVDRIVRDDRFLISTM
jgi:hypothetical protein